MQTFYRKDGTTVRVTLHYVDGQEATVRAVYSMSESTYKGVDVVELVTASMRSLGDSISHVMKTERVVVGKHELRAVELTVSRDGLVDQTRVYHLHPNTIVGTSITSKKNKVANPNYAKRKPKAPAKPKAAKKEA